MKTLTFVEKSFNMFLLKSKPPYVESYFDLRDFHLTANLHFCSIHNRRFFRTPLANLEKGNNWNQACDDNWAWISPIFSLHLVRYTFHRFVKCVRWINFRFNLTDVFF